MTSRERKKRGRKPDILKIEGDWKTAIKRALKKKRPNDGWPMEDQKAKQKK